MDGAPAISEVQEAERRIAHVPLVLNRRNFNWLTQRISEVVEQPAPRWWWVIFTITASAATFGLFCIGYQISTGVGTWGNQIPVGWAWDITNFVFWIGIGHAGTLISAILFLLRQKWRTSINRSAEAMTLFAVICAAIFPGIHVGRFWMAWYLAPIPNNWGIWQNFRSALMWDVFAVSTYGTVSLIFWYVGLIPDLATLRDRAKQRWQQVIFGMLSMGWRGSARHWHRYQVAYLLLAGLATPLVLSVHTVVSFDFATGIVPGWHTTIFPPYFVAGAIYSGFAMVLTLAIPLRKAYGLEGFITLRHLEQMAKVMLATGLIVAYGYFIEFFMAFYSGNKFDVFLAKQRLHGPYAPFYYALILCNILTPQLLWFKKVRRNIPALFVMSLIINTGMWLERFVIVVISLTRDFMPSAWGRYSATVWDYATFVGTLGLFTMLIFLFVRGLPAIAISEMRELVHQDSHGNEGHS